VYANFVFWGVLDLIVALIALYAGMSLLRGGAFGLVMGYLFAGLTAIRWLVVIPAAPILSVVMIALSVRSSTGLPSTPTTVRAREAIRDGSRRPFPGVRSSPKRAEDTVLVCNLGGRSPPRPWLHLHRIRVTE